MSRGRICNRGGLKGRLCAAMCVLLLLCACTSAEDLDQRIGLDGVGNARDLGGYPAEDGRIVARGVFLRTAALANASEEDIRQLKDDYRLCLVIDFRTTSEIEAAPDPEIDGVEYLHLGIIDEADMAAKQQAISAEDVEGLDLTNKIDQLKLAIRLGIIGENMYIDFLSGEQGKKGYAQLFQEILALPEGRSLLFHCTQGKDRTGLAAMLILSALGVDEETILYDYALTNIFNAELIERERQMLEGMGVEDDAFDLYMTAMDQVDPQYMVHVLDWMKANYGSVLGYIQTELGVTGEEIESLRDQYLELVDDEEAA